MVKQQAELEPMIFKSHSTGVQHLGADYIQTRKNYKRMQDNKISERQIEERSKSQYEKKLETLLKFTATYS